MQKIIILALLILSFPIFLLAHAEDPHDELIIRMTKNGFEPREITVTLGDEILFINNDDSDRWPASNYHPTHTLDPEFDPLKGIPPGESWKHVFDKVGIWRMHDHLFPHMTGTIVVLENPASSTPQVTGTVDEGGGFFYRVSAFFVNLWQKIFNRENEIQQSLLQEFKDQNEKAKYAWLENIAEKNSPETAWRYVKAAYDTPEGVVGNPHDMAHLVGQLLFKAYGFSGLPTCEPIFAFGCYHGLMEVAFDKDRPDKYVDSFFAAQNGCKTLGDDNSSSYWSCIHGMGHGVLTYRELDLDKALEDCDMLDERIRTYCHDGTFMELSISAPPSFYKKENPIYPCNSVAEAYQGSCGRSQAQVMRTRFNMKTNAIAEACLATNKERLIYNCIDAIGYFMTQLSGRDPKKIILGCQEIEEDQSAAQCLAAAAGELIFQDYVGWQDTVTVICNSLSGQYKDSCYKRVEQVKQSYGRS